MASVILFCFRDGVQSNRKEKSSILRSHIVDVCNWRAVEGDETSQSTLIFKLLDAEAGQTEESSTSRNVLDDIVLNYLRADLFLV